tara:strand:+ start:82 stop:243 length:162 start_codon:yes stop_codon:yes gene_type:complete
MAEKKMAEGQRWLKKDGTSVRIMKVNPKSVRVRDRDGNLKTINPSTLVTYVKG